jgi:hypothetical protein
MQQEYNSAFLTRRRFLAVLAALLFFAAIDGVCSLVLVGRRFSDPRSWDSHVEYDPLLGFIAKPGVHIPNAYGPGAAITTNSLRMRGRREYDAVVPPGRTRLLCLGDSFTFGHGVGDDQAWPAVLGRLDPRLETMNMGENGYGFGEMFLRYQRDGLTLDHDAVIVSFIWEDLVRMKYSVLYGYPKPVLGMVGDRLVLKSEPLPRRSWRVPLRHRLKILDDLQLVSLLRSALTGPATAPDLAAKPVPLDQSYWETVFEIMARMVRTCHLRGREVFFVYLPSLHGLRTDDLVETRNYLAERCNSAGIRFVDLTPAFAALPRTQQDNLYLPEEGVPLTTIHYSPEGHAFVAAEVKRQIVEDLMDAGGG